MSLYIDERSVLICEIKFLSQRVFKTLYSIDLLEWIQIIWDVKWKIVSILAVSLLSVFGFNIINPDTTFIAQTEIKPITSFQLDKYMLFYASLKRFDKKNTEINIFNISKAQN